MDELKKIKIRISVNLKLLELVNSKEEYRELIKDIKNDFYEGMKIYFSDCKFSKVCKEFDNCKERKCSKEDCYEKNNRIISLTKDIKSLMIHNEKLGANIYAGSIKHFKMELKELVDD